MAGVEPSGGVAVSHGVWHAGVNLIPNPPKNPFLVRIVSFAMPGSWESEPRDFSHESSQDKLC